MSGEFDGRRLAQVSLSDVTLTDDENGKWICGLCVLKLEGADQGTYGPSVSIDIAAPFLPEMSRQDGELALIRRAIELLKHVAAFSPTDIQSSLAA